MRLVARGARVAVRALHPRGERLAAAIARRLAAVPVIGPGPAVELRTDRERLASPSPLDAARALLAGLPDGSGAPPAFPIALAGALAFDLIDAFERLPPRPRAAGPEEADLDLALALDGARYGARHVVVACRALDGGEDERRAARARASARR